MVPPEKEDVSSRHNLAAVQPDQDGWAGLIARTAQGDEGALADLYDGTAALVNGLALRILGDPGAGRGGDRGCLPPGLAPGGSLRFVIAGDLRVAGRHLHAGDYHRADQHSTHDETASEGGCLLLFVESPA